MPKSEHDCPYHQTGCAAEEAYSGLGLDWYDSMPTQAFPITILDRLGDEDVPLKTFLHGESVLVP
ncbi:MAG TPA: hypothetical protein VKT72_00910 [Candidatus Baltobacteraceae bacterium]|nr:hypothetical protein [Candidatus Baltobacteraceae bacterium]